MAMEKQSCNLPPPGHVYGLLMLNVLMPIMGSIGDVLVILAIIKTPTLPVMSTYWLASLAIADLFVTALGQHCTAFPWTCLLVCCYSEATKVQLVFNDATPDFMVLILDL